MKTLQSFITESDNNNTVMDFLNKYGIKIVETKYHDFTFENIEKINNVRCWICKKTTDNDPWNTTKNIIRGILQPKEVKCFIPKNESEKKQLSYCPFGLLTISGQIITPMEYVVSGWRGTGLLFADTKTECNQLFSK